MAPAPKPSGGLSVKQIKAAHLVAEDMTDLKDIAASLGISRTTLYYWSKLPEFRAEVDRVCREIAAELMPSALKRLKRNIERAGDKESNQAISIALKAAGWLTKDDTASKADQDFDAALAEIDERSSGSPS